MIFTVTLTDYELISCRMIGNMRSYMCRSMNVPKSAARPSMENDEDGVIGELAFCKHKNIYFDMTANIRTNTYDCILSGKKFDIKSTRWPEGKLLAGTTRNPDVEVFALAIIDQNTVTFPGYVLADAMYVPENITDLGYGPVYAVAQKDLTQWK